jgi:hypothetical protein
MVDGRLGSRSRGYHPVAPRPLKYGPFLHHLSSSRHLQRRSTRHDRSLLVKDGIGLEMTVQFDLKFRLPRKSQGSFTCRKSATWDRRLYFPSEGRHAEDFFARKIRRLRSDSNPRSWVPEGSTRPPKPFSKWYSHCAYFTLYNVNRLILYNSSGERLLCGTCWVSMWNRHVSSLNG